MYKNKCKYCKKEFEVENWRTFAQHVGRCKKRPDYFDILSKISNNKKSGKIETFKCERCGKIFQQYVTSRGFVKQYCSRGCSNSRLQTKEIRKRKSITVSKWYKEVGVSEETRKIHRINRQKQILKNGGGPQIGRHEIQLLDEFELSNNIKLIRQYPIVGYYVDGYCEELNIVVEIDERPKINERDKRREKEIIKELKCKLIRVIDY